MLSFALSSKESSKGFFMKISLNPAAVFFACILLSSACVAPTNPVPSATPSPTPAPSSTPVHSPTPAPISTAGRVIPNPIYGVTLDNVDNTILPGEITSFQHLVHMPTARVVFDSTEAAAYYLPQIQKLRPVAYIMGEILDSTDMSAFTVSSFQSRAQSYVQALGSSVDLWEVGNEVNGGWLGTNTLQKIEAAYDMVSASKGATAITFFWEGLPSDPNNCIDASGDDLFTWITNNFQLNLPASQRSAESEKVRLGLNYALISWYPANCPAMAAPDWVSIYTQLAGIFPNAKVGFGELGTSTPQNGSAYEINLINQYYPMATTLSLPSNYIGGYFWWNYAEEMVPYTNPLFTVLNHAIK